MKEVAPRRWAIEVEEVEEVAYGGALPSLFEE